MRPVFSGGALGGLTSAVAGASPYKRQDLACTGIVAVPGKRKNHTLTAGLTDTSVSTIALIRGSPLRASSFCEMVKQGMPFFSCTSAYAMREVAEALMQVSKVSTNRLLWQMGIIGPFVLGCLPGKFRLSRPACRA